ncbi:bacteriohopanetetrol glucosamine biosynthesis glycosyltransferase HpnI [Sphingomonas quercus]|uniref:Bacteriohopanetetrol glucosamine biosynthesis glycosyltransferase HpnI n=1 Tax=Sphingomonas quercus TaxID=2842451 RepID=A0ABS6BMA5_9SPHN|nr:bacteriohopanetetrol glucosamine biosynthesis glycosyltransferase HpnI [Sphingomonas quercus]MBU3079454.1 bacteriohopanetetrol glucosamine biosynthesis glycosyltransferase HpnI [Sphingomonas quercus]
MASLALIGHALGWVLLGLSALGTAYMVAAGLLLRRHFRDASAGAAPRAEAVTLLKPLHGAEPRLYENLASFLDQHHAGPIQLLCGVQRPDDPAIAIVKRLRRERAGVRIDLVVDATPHGANRKVANLINLAPHIAHPIIVLSDSDIVAPRDYLARLLATLDLPGVGAVTCLYHGRGDAGFWSRLGAAGLSWQFLPGALFAVANGLARPCMGSTIALRQEMLAAIGGFRPFADMLADDYAIGEAIHALGQRVAVPDMLVTHASDEPSLAALWRHELRWGATLKEIVPAAYIAGVIGIPLPTALAGWVLVPAGLWFVLGALAVRVAVAGVADREAGARTAPLWLLPLRDCFTFAIFIGSLFARSVDWRGAKLKMSRNGRVTAGQELFP